MKPTRRQLLSGALAALPTAAIARASDGDPIERAMATMGGKHLLSQVKSIGWLGAAEIVTPERTLRLGMDTRIEPFVRARSKSWTAGDRPSRIRTLTIEPTAGYVDRDGARTPLPHAQEIHERQQYGLYAYLLLAFAPDAAIGTRIHAVRAGFPPITFDTGVDGRITGADYTVAAPDAGLVIQQRFSFGGMIADNGLRWPRRIAIAQDGVPFFTLAIDRLRVELR